MKSKDLQNIMLSKYQKGDASTEIYWHLNGGIRLATIKRWCRMMLQSCSIQLLGTRAGPWIVRSPKRVYQNFKTVCAENRR